MHAKVGDWLVVNRATVGQEPLRGLIIEVRSADGSPPYVVRWTDDDHTALIFPGPDAQVMAQVELDELDERRARRANHVQQLIRRRFGSGASREAERVAGG